MKKLFVIVLMLVAVSSNAQWVQQYYAGDNIALDAIQFVNANTGFAIGEENNFNAHVAVFLKTTNGGVNWDRINMNIIFDQWLYAISFINENTGWVCGKSSLIRKTTDGGITWESYYAATNTPNFNAIQFLNDQTGYVGGRYGMVAKSTNGGVNWTALDTALTHINVLHFFDANTGIMGDASSGIYRTTNGGLNWAYTSQTDSVGQRYAFYSLSSADANTVYIIGTTYYNGFLIKTTNKGLSWNVVRKFNNEMEAVFAMNSSTVYVGGTMNYNMFSTNGGLTWTNQIIPYTGNISIRGMFFTNANTGFCSGTSGYIFRTTNGGVWVKNISTETPTAYSLSQNYPNPFNPTTKIKFSIVNSVDVKLVVYDIMGREVQTLVNERLQTGTYEVAFDGSKLNSGIYFCKLTTNGFFEVKKMLLLK